MKYVIVPAPVTLLAPSGEPYTELVDGEVTPLGRITLHGYLQRFVLPDPKFGKGRKASRASRALREAFMPAMTYAIVPVEDDHWDRMQRCIEEPTGEQNQVIMEQLVEFQDEICEARGSLKDAEKRLADNFGLTPRTAADQFDVGDAA